MVGLCPLGAGSRGCATALSRLYCVQLSTASSPECSTCLLGAVPAGMGGFLPVECLSVGRC